MLIVAISFGTITDPFSCSCQADRSKTNPDDMESVLKGLIDVHQGLHKTQIDELLVIENDSVIATYNFEDGLGEQFSPDYNDE